MAKHNLFVIDPPDENARGKYLLLIQRHAATAFSASANAVISVDWLQHNSHGHYGYLEGEKDPEVVFALAVPFLMVKKSLTRLTTEVEMTRDEYENHKEMKKLMQELDPQPEPGNEAFSGTHTPPGMYL